MTAPTIADYLKFANLQMAAEAFLVGDVGKIKDDIALALKEGNKHASRFPDVLAESFAAQWEVVAQQPDTKTGFSGALFRNKANPSELVISFRSTEFIDDAARDNEATNKLVGKAVNDDAWRKTA